jgi:hypothetical protein
MLGEGHPSSSLLGAHRFTDELSASVRRDEEEEEEEEAESGSENLGTVTSVDRKPDSN